MQEEENYKEKQRKKTCKLSRTTSDRIPGSWRWTQEDGT